MIAISIPLAWILSKAVDKIEKLKFWSEAKT
jgi:hypothetical protein